MIGATRDDDLDEGGVIATPFYRRRKVQILGAVGVLVIGYFLFSKGKAPQQVNPNQTTKQTYIDSAFKYQPAFDDAVTPPKEAPAAPAKATPDVKAATAPTGPSLGKVMAGQYAPDPRPVMRSYAVHFAPPAPPTVPPTEAPETTLAFRTATLPGSKASPAIDETYMLMPGLLPCVLDTAINSTLPGPLLAHLDYPVYSTKHVLLMEAGTQIVGRYESMGKNGGNRLMASTAYAHTPNGIWVPLTDEPLTDDLGRNGLPGGVDNHYMERFGGAVLLDLTDSVLQILQAEVSKGGNSYINLNSGSGVGSLAQNILNSTINIAPTFTKNQGETIAILIDKPIDFSASYRIRRQR